MKRCSGKGSRAPRECYKSLPEAYRAGPITRGLMHVLGDRAGDRAGYMGFYRRALLGLNH